jgi:hypothetical protein
MTVRPSRFAQSMISASGVRSIPMSDAWTASCPSSTNHRANVGDNGMSTRNFTGRARRSHPPRGTPHSAAPRRCRQVQDTDNSLRSAGVFHWKRAQSEQTCDRRSRAANAGFTRTDLGIDRNAGKGHIVPQQLAATWFQWLTRGPEWQTASRARWLSRWNGQKRPAGLAHPSRGASCADKCRVLRFVSLRRRSMECIRTSSALSRRRSTAARHRPISVLPRRSQRPCGALRRQGRRSAARTRSTQSCRRTPLSWPGRGWSGQPR